MRIITSYAYTLDTESVEEAAWRFKVYQGVMDDWLRDQGVNDPREDSPADTYVQLKRRDISHSGAEIDGFLLQQPILESSHVLHTRFDLAVTDQSLALFLQFSLERKTSRIAPASYQISCPRALQTILDAGNWKSGQARVQPRCRPAFGREAGKTLRSEIQDSNRTLPIVLLANFPDNRPLGEYQELNQPYSDDEWEDFVNRLEDDLGGVALLAELDSEGEDALLPTVLRSPLVENLKRPDREPPVLRTRDRSHGMCGAVVRVVWPLGTDDFDPTRHPAWAPYDLFAHPDSGDFRNDDGYSTDPPEWMATFGREQLMLLRRYVRDMVYEQAALQPVPQLIDNIRRRYAAAERERLTATGDVEILEELYREEIEERDRQIDTLQESLARREKDWNDLRTNLDQKQARINQLQFQLGQAKGASDTSEHAEEGAASREPATVAEAIEIAESEYELVVFGPDVLTSVRSLDPTAGPPGRILRDLKKLNECCETLAQGPLGQDVLAWLKEEGLNVARESDTRRGKHEDKLTFKTADGDTALMGNHISYRGNSLNRQVRIHFRLREADSDGQRFFEIGYIGPKIAEQ